MKNKGRRQLAGNGSFQGIGNCKGALVVLTRSITQMGTGQAVEGWRGFSKKFLKKKWHKRVRGYFKSQTKELL